MSNVFKNSLLIIVAVILCTIASLIGSSAFAQSELLFPVAKSVSYTAPSLDAVFADHLQVDVSFNSTVSTPSVFVDTAIDTTIYIEEVSVQNSFMVQSSLRFPVLQRTSYTAPSLDIVFSNTNGTMSAVHSYTENLNAENTFLARSELRFPVAEKVSYTAPDLKVVFTGTSHDGASVTQVTVNKGVAQSSFDNEQEEVAQNIASLQKQVIDLQRRVALLKEQAVASDFGCGSCGDHVQNLQRFLNRNDFILATAGAGSIGSETPFFGPRTLAALKRFQSTHNIPVTGVADSQTRTLINSIEPDVLNNVITANCVIPKQKDEKEGIIRNDQTDTDGIESTSGSFFTDVFKKIADFFLHLFLIA